mgnify:CR=1 FL=1
MPDNRQLLGNWHLPGASLSRNSNQLFFGEVARYAMRPWGGLIRYSPLGNISGYNKVGVIETENPIKPDIAGAVAKLTVHCLDNQRVRGRTK